MRAREFVKEDSSASSVTSGDVAVISQPMSGMIYRTRSLDPAKYMNSFNPGKKRKKNAGR